MKLFKQVLIFCVFTAAIYGVFAFVTAGKPAINTSALLGSNVDEISREITTEWSSLDGWDRDVYDRQMTMVAQSHNSNIINDDARKSLYDRVNKEAYTKAVAAMTAEFARADADENVLRLNDDGLMTISSREPGIERIPEVTEAETIYRLYCRVKQFNNRSFAAVPRFDGESGTWTPSFASIENNARSTRERLINEPYFRPRLSHITEMRKIHNTDTKLADARSKFYDNLGDQIVNYFNGAIESTEPGSEDRKELRMKFQTVRSAVYNETSGNHRINARLRDFLDKL